MIKEIENTEIPRTIERRKKRNCDSIASAIKASFEEISENFNGSIKLNFNNGGIRSIEMKKTLK